MSGQRTGVPTLLATAHLLCKYIVKFTPVIERLYPESPALIAALAAANAACAALGSELQAVREYGD